MYEVRGDCQGCIHFDVDKQPCRHVDSPVGLGVERHVELLSWNSELGQELRKDLLDTWRWICGSVGKLALERVQEGCIKLIKIVGFVEGREVFFKERKAPKARFLPGLEGAITQLWSKGSSFLFGGDVRSALSLTRRLVGGKPLSHASVLGKLHAREILHLLMDEKAHDSLSLAPMVEKSCEAVSCEALMKTYRAQVANNVDHGIPSA